MTYFVLSGTLNLAPSIHPFIHPSTVLPKTMVFLVKLCPNSWLRKFRRNCIYFYGRLLTILRESLFGCGQSAYGRILIDLAFQSLGVIRTRSIRPYPFRLLSGSEWQSDKMASVFLSSGNGEVDWNDVVWLRGGDYRGDGGETSPQHFGWGGRKRKCPPTNYPFSYFVDICLMFASQIQLKIINCFCVLMVNLN